MNNGVKYRIRFSKTGKMRFIGHLDLLNFFQRAIRRAGLPISYSQGFNPHQLTSFAIPLPLGMKSECEFLDIQLNEQTDCEEIKNRLNSVMTQGIEIMAVRELSEDEKGCAAVLEAAVYEIETEIDDLAKRYAEIEKKQHWLAEKKSKKGVKEVDIKPDVYSAEIFEKDNKTILRVCIATGSQNNLKPDLLLSYIYGCIGVEFEPYKTEITRLQLLKKTEKGFELL